MTHMDTCVCLGVILEMKIIFLKLLIILRFLTYNILRNIEFMLVIKQNCSYLLENRYTLSINLTHKEFF